MHLHYFKALVATFLVAIFTTFAPTATSAKECEVAISSKPGFVEPGPDVPAEYRRFFGTWGYGWTGFNCGLVAIVKVSPQGEVNLIYGWGRLTDLHGKEVPAGFMRMRGKIDGNKILLQTNRFSLSLTYGETGIGYSHSGAHIGAIYQGGNAAHDWGKNRSGLNPMVYPLHPELASGPDECEVAVPSRYEPPRINHNEVNRNFIPFLGPWKTGRANDDRRGRCSKLFVESIDVRGKTQVLFSMGINAEGLALYQRVTGTISNQVLSTMVTGTVVTFSLQENLSLLGNVESQRGWFSTTYTKKTTVQVSAAK